MQKKLTDQSKTQVDRRSQLTDLCDHDVFNCLMAFVTRAISKLRNKLHVKYLQKTKRDHRLLDTNRSTSYYPRDFPSYIQAVHAFEVETVANQDVRNRDIARQSNSANEGGQWSNDRVQRAQLPENSSVTFDQTPSTRSQKCRRTLRHKKSKSYCKRKAPIQLDTSNVINLSNVTLTEDEKLLLSRGLTFCPTPRHIDWTQVTS